MELRKGISMNLESKPYGNRKPLVGLLHATFLGIPLLLFASTASTAQGSKPLATSAASNAQTYDVCIANFFFTPESGVGRSVTTWAPVPNPDLRKTIANFKAVAAISGFEVGDEDYRGSEGAVTLFMKTAENAQKFPLRVEVDRELGTISMAGRANPDQDIPVVQARELMCHMIAFSAGAPPASASLSSSKGLVRNPFRKPAKRASKDEENTRIHRAELDALHQRALLGGKAIVIIPSVNLKEKYAKPDDIQSRQAELLIDRTSTTIWQDSNDPRNAIKVGADVTADNVGLHGYTYAFVANKTRYFVYIVDPGTYTVAGSTYEAIHASMPQPASKKKSSASRLGQVSLAQVKSTEFYQTQAWFDAVYQDREIRDDYCTLAIAGGPCVQWNSSSHTVQDQLHAGGFREVTKSRAVDGLVVAAKLSKPFASFNVSPGEVVMVDGFFAEYPNAKFDDHRCEQVSGVNVQCDLKQYTLLRISAQIDDLKTLDESPINLQLPILRNILRDAKYRPATVSATPDKSVPSFGMRYTLNSQ